MSNVINLQAQIHSLSQALLEAEKKMMEANAKYARFVDRSDFEAYHDHPSDDEGEELRLARDEAEANYDAIEDEIFVLEEELEDLFNDQHSRTDEEF